MALNVERFIALNIQNDAPPCVRRHNAIANLREFDGMEVGGHKFFAGDGRVRRAWASAAKNYTRRSGVKFKVLTVTTGGLEGVSIRRTA
jgi:hypothetical protein